MCYRIPDGMLRLMTAHAIFHTVYEFFGSGVSFCDIIILSILLDTMDGTGEVKIYAWSFHRTAEQ